MLHRQHGLHQAGCAGRRLKVADVGLDRADQQRTVRFASPAVCRSQGQRFNGIAHFRARSVRFHIVHFRRPDTGAGERLLDYPFLRRPVRHGEARTGPVLVHGRSADHGPDAVAIRFRLFQPFQDDDSATFTPYVTVRPGVEGRAPPVRRKHTGVGPKFEQCAGEDRVNTTSERKVRIAPLQSRDGLVHGDQRRRTGRVQRHRGTLESQDVGDPADGRVEGRAGDRIEACGRFGRFARAQDQVAVVVVADPRVDAGSASLQTFRIHPGILERLPAHLEHHALLRIQPFRLNGRDTEERRIEEIQFVEVGAEPAGRVRHARIGKQFAHPSGAGTGLALYDGVPAFFKQAPEGGQVGGLREPAGHADHGDGLIELRGARYPHRGVSVDFAVRSVR